MEELAAQMLASEEALWASRNHYGGVAATSLQLGVEVMISKRMFVYNGLLSLRMPWRTCFFRVRALRIGFQLWHHERRLHGIWNLSRRRGHRA